MTKHEDMRPLARIWQRKLDTRSMVVTTCGKGKRRSDEANGMGTSAFQVTSPKEVEWVKRRHADTLTLVSNKFGAETVSRNLSHELITKQKTPLCLIIAHGHSDQRAHRHAHTHAPSVA